MDREVPQSIFAGVKGLCRADEEPAEHAVGALKDLDLVA
ncbi:hypothetical protein RvY_14582 [Ramazzottius varieornatus]|uniref:Uncharacterized protein n=1 Tax=Ramazzottius varieornatus TaxID=947166 RepID=A0A1D1VWX3_RAMVA|nr:hypothetical protein RvY_14582 [Ramazzottius varieornatus]